MSDKAAFGSLWSCITAGIVPLGIGLLTYVANCPWDIVFSSTCLVASIACLSIHRWVPTKPSPILGSDGTPFPRKVLLKERWIRWTISGFILIVFILVLRYAPFSIAEVRNPQGSSLQRTKEGIYLENSPGGFQISVEGPLRKANHAVTFEIHKNSRIDRVLLDSIVVSYVWIDAKLVKQYSTYPENVIPPVIYQASLRAESGFSEATLTADGKLFEGLVHFDDKNPCGMVRVEFDGDPGAYLVRVQVRLSDGTGWRKRTLETPEPILIVLSPRRENQ